MERNSGDFFMEFRPGCADDRDKGRNLQFRGAVSTGIVLISLPVDFPFPSNFMHTLERNVPQNAENIARFPGGQTKRRILSHLWLSWLSPSRFEQCPWEVAARNLMKNLACTRALAGLSLRFAAFVGGHISPQKTKKTLVLMDLAHVVSAGSIHHVM